MTSAVKKLERAWNESRPNQMNGRVRRCSRLDIGLDEMVSTTSRSSISGHRRSRLGIVNSV